MYRHTRRRDEGKEVELTASEFRTIILTSLTKVNNRDTIKNGVDELVGIIKELSLEDESLNIFIGCLLDNGDSQTSQYKRETMRIIASIASVHQDSLQQFLSRIVIACSKYIKDKDTSVRDACAESIGLICRYVSLPEAKTENDTSIGIYMKPFFLVSAEHNKHYQVGAAMCITAVIKNLPDREIILNLARLIARFQKLLNSPSCLARSNLLLAVGAVVESARLDCIPYVPTIVSLMADGFTSAEWDARKSAAEGIQKIGSSLREAMSAYKKDILDLLEKYRFDKIKPVRDAINVAIDIFQTLPGSSSPEKPSNAIGASETLKRTIGRNNATIGRSATLKEIKADRGRSNTITGLPAELRNTLRPSTTSSSYKSISHTVYVPPPPKTAPTPDKQVISSGSSQLEEQNQSSQIQEDVTDNNFEDTSIDQLRASNATEQVSMANTSPVGRLQRALTLPNIGLVVPDLKNLVNSSSDKRLDKLNVESQNSLRAGKTYDQQAKSNVATSNNANDSWSNDTVASSATTSKVVSSKPPETRSRGNSAADKPGVAESSNPPSVAPASMEAVLAQLHLLTEQNKRMVQIFEEFASTTKQEISQLKQKIEKLETQAKAPSTPKTESTPRASALPTDLNTPLNSTSEEKPRNMNENPNVWDAAMDRLSIGHYDGAYSRILKEGDTLQLIRIMEKTGPCLDRLEPNTSATLFSKFIVFLKTNSYTDLVFPWVHQALARAVIPLSQQQIVQLIRALGDLGASPTSQGVEAAKLESEVKRHMAHLPI